VKIGRHPVIVAAVRDGGQETMIKMGDQCMNGAKKRKTKAAKRSRNQAQAIYQPALPLSMMATIAATGVAKNTTVKKFQGPSHFNTPSAMAIAEVTRKSDRSPNWIGFGAGSGRGAKVKEIWPARSLVNRRR
jgi:hypothetical protein